MAFDKNKFDRFLELTKLFTPKEGDNFYLAHGFGAVRYSSVREKYPTVDDAVILIMAQGKKYGYVGDKKYEFIAGEYQLMFFPTPMQVQMVEASPDKPFLAVGFLINLAHLSDIILKIDRVDTAPHKPVVTDPSGIFTAPLNDNLLDPVVRFMEALTNPKDISILGKLIIEEIYYRLLTDERGSELRALLQQRGQIQRISKAIEFIHQNLEKPLSVEQLASLVGMSRTGFFDNFKSVMHMPPLQYIKSVKLHKAQTLIKEGKNAGEAGYMVGYNSPAQFSREYKRHYGFAPSAT